MKRYFIPGTVDRHGVARATSCCTGECNQGRSCPLTIDRVCKASMPLEPIRQRPVIGAQLHPGQVIPIRAAVTLPRPSLGVRMWRGWREFLAFLLAPRWMS